MKVDLNDLISAKFQPIVEAMLFIVVEAIQFLDTIGITSKNSEPSEGELSTLVFVRDAYLDKLKTVRKLLIAVDYWLI